MFELLFNFLPLIFEDSTPAVQPKLDVLGIKYFYPYNILLLNSKINMPDFNTTSYLRNWFKLAKCIQNTLTTDLTHFLS